ncbi:MAG: hypothetical protein RLZZ623_1017 [Actinomycetota bacterium]
MRSLSGNYAAVVDAIDAANAGDPTVVSVRGHGVALAFAHGRLAVEWVEFLRPDADELVLIAARAHHLRRWEVARSTYPEGRTGYLAWKRDQRHRHATDVAQLMEAAHYPPEEIERVQALVRRDRLASDPDAQLVEDAACLVFIETQLADVARRLDHDLLVGVLRKTARKLSVEGAAAISRIPLGDFERALLAEALIA